MHQVNAAGTSSARDQLLMILVSKVGISYTTKNINSSVKADLRSLPIKSFVPFVQERDGVGRMLPSLSENTLKKTKVKEPITSHSPPLTRRNSAAFSSTVAKTTSRRQKEIYPSPPIGLYDPTPAYQITAHAKVATKTSNTGRFTNRHRQTQSIDFVDYNQAYKTVGKRVSGFSMQHQLAREKVEYDYEKERAELYRPGLKLPDHLKKFKGLFHISDIKPEESNVMKQDCADMGLRMNTIKATITGLKDFGKEITKDMFKSKRTTIH